MALYSELPIYKLGTELLSLAVDVHTQIPRIYKRTLGEKIHQQCVEILECLAMANACRGADRVRQLDDALTRVRAVTALLRVGNEKRAIGDKLWSRSIELLDAIGAQAGGWRKQTLSTAAPAA